MAYEYKESYKHLLAKKLLASWFREQEEINDSCKVAQFTWRFNYGVYEELKFYETSDPFYFENSKGLIHDIENPNYLEWFDPDFNKGKILFVPDITVFHKGSPKYIFEIIHTNPISQRKKRIMRLFFKGNYVEVHEIQSEDILKNDSMSVPSFIPTNRIL